MNQLAERVVQMALKCGKAIVVAESCTGGMLSAALTDVPGSSAIFDCGFVAYSYESKSKLLNVPMEQLMQHGAVSASIAALMVKGALLSASADIGISITGIAGPGGATEEKPVGLVYFAISDGMVCETHRKVFQGNRTTVRKHAVTFALEVLLEWLGR